ncbi:UbiD family decarboxylase [Hyphomicrobium sp. LHD-15]|uniref:UbiD family decarboxylase n=1 Tax=Hyphomicrobium sp. LHD-15 TaxID=3072142 RepID=UPI00280CDA5F|nr:UbiD family decarboxylase [Hyphomicrobium sp. LHD-15]MDQ8698256.1 UbiD family decarboxylase [Hyphomicrobium sp. LHD-15]
MRELPKFRDLRAFLSFLDAKNALARVSEPVSVVHEITEIHRRVLEAGGPAILFERPIRADGMQSDVPILVNLFGTVERVSWGLGIAKGDIRRLGELLGALREPDPVDGFRDALSRWPMVKAALNMRPAFVNHPVVQKRVHTGRDIALDKLPIQVCWPDEPGPLVTWPLVLTRPPNEESISHYNAGVYRMQVVGSDQAILRWLAHRGGAAHHRLWASEGRDMPVAVVIGADPATILSAVLPLPEVISELRFSGILRGERPRLARCVSVPLVVPADAEFVIEGFVSSHETRPEGPFGDHTGYYNSVESFPLMRVTAITSRHDPIYLSTYTGRPPDEPSVIGQALNELFIPILRRHLPEIVDCWLPPDACSYRMAIVSIRKRYAGQARRVMMALWSLLMQFSYTKVIVVVDEDIDVRNWRDISWALATRMDPSRDLTVIDRTPIDYLDFASPVSGLGGKLGIDATTKIGTETDREWGRVLAMDAQVVERVNEMWERLGLCDDVKRGVAGDR